MNLTDSDYAELKPFIPIIRKNRESGGSRIIREAHQLMARICEQRHGTPINLSCGDCQQKMYNIINSLLDTYENGK